MKCPVCPDAQLAMTDRQGIEIDYCPSCRGVWLDRGELDKLIERSMASGEASASPPPAARRPDFQDSDFGRSGHSRHRRKSWLSEIFD